MTPTTLDIRRPLPLPGSLETTDERAARRELREQIARLEEQLAGQVTTAFPRSPRIPRIGGEHGARLQTLTDLEHRRDALAGALAEVRARLDELGRRQEQARGRLENIMLEPEAHPWERVTHEDIGEPGCRQYHARPRRGLLGLLMNWWRVIISSGCPLCTPSQGQLR